jgi:hypothetical protein
MSKKILGICAALVALAALAIPSLASAATTLRENGVPIVPGAKITATQDEHSVFESGGVGITCSENWMTGEVHTNDHTNGITGTITAASFKGTESETRCNGGSLLGPTRVKIPTLETGGDWCIKNVAGTDNFSVLGRGCTAEGNGTLTFVLEGSLTCRYSRSEGVSGAITTGTGTLKVTGEPVFSGSGEGNSFLCPSSGKITTMAFNLFTDNAEEAPLTIDNA